MKMHHTILSVILLAILAFMFGTTGCVVYKNADTYFGAVGTDADEVETPEGLRIVKMNNSVAFKETAKLVDKMWKAYLTLQGFKFVAGKYYDHQGKVVDGETTVKLEELRNAKSEADAAAALEQLKLTHATAAPSV